MCGIVGVLGNHEAAPTLVDALRRLEYRGYDSAGIATVNAGRLERRRALGKLVNLSDLLVYDPLAGRVGIGHTRWATHGAPTLANAHPQQAGPVAVVHNGIIENHRELRESLREAGVTFESETDTEVIVQLTRIYLNAGLAPREAVQKTLSRLEGAFALCFLFAADDDLLIAARKNSPLAVGHGDGEMFVGSDALALAPMTSRVSYLEDGDIAVITRAGVEFLDADGHRVQRPLIRISSPAEMFEKGGYRHFMAREIAAQPRVLEACISHYLDKAKTAIALPEGTPDFATAERLVMVACGTAHYACMVAKYWFEKLAGLPVDVDVASEFRYRSPPLAAGTLAVFVSQSGETADTLAALRYCRDKAAKLIAVVNVSTSSIAREADLALPIMAGVEIGVASTKAFTCQLATLATMAILAARQRGRIDSAVEARLVATLRNCPALVNQAMALEAQITALAAEVSKARDALFLGRGLMYPIALEGALKLKEISYLHAEGYASGELKHGPIALVDKDVPVVVMAPKDALFGKTVSNMQEVMARGGRVILISDAEGTREARDGAWRILTMPRIEPIFAPILYAIPAQLLAYHVAVHRGTDVDQPRNLAKSVTVE